MERETFRWMDCLDDDDDDDDDDDGGNDDEDEDCHVIMVNICYRCTQLVNGVICHVT